MQRKIAILRCLAVVAFSLLGCAVARADTPFPRNEPYPGVLTLQVDASDVERRILRVHETLPVFGRSLTLLYPQWLPGHHAARGTIDQLAGLVIRAREHALTWHRDPLDPFAFRVDVPLSVSEISVDFQVATPQSAEQGRVVFTPAVLGLQWTQVVLYPAGNYASQILVNASLKVPGEWHWASALGVTATGEWVRFAPATLEVLADSPVFAGRYTGQLDLAPGQAPPVHLDLFAESSADLAPTQAELDAHRALVRETYAALGRPFYDHYDFLLALSDYFGAIGLEHHRSSEDAQSPSYFRAWDDNMSRRDLLAHEFVHAWNGKRRRPADLWTPNFNVPMQNSLLWVYEGMTEYYGLVLTSRAGMWSGDFARETLASWAAVYDRKRPGRSWRSLADTTSQPQITARRPLAWVSWQRTEDYYSEAALLWLGIDARLRELTHGAQGLDAAASAFLAAPAQQGLVSTYQFKDVVHALDAVAPYDWKKFIETRVNEPGAPLDALEIAGLRLTYTDRPNAYLADVERERKIADFSYSVGFVVAKDSQLAEVVWEGPAFKAGLTTNTTLVAVNGRAYTAELLREAITRAKGTSEPIELIVRNQDRYRVIRLDYHEGLQYPHLAVAEGAADRLAEILKPRT